MWDDFKGHFEKFSFTDPDQSNEKRHPIQSKKPITICYQKAKKWVEGRKDIEGLIISEDFHEIFFKDQKCEITIIFLELPSGGTLISSHVASNAINKSRKTLYNVLENVRKVVEN